jgi:hypothetical protein
MASKMQFSSWSGMNEYVALFSRDHFGMGGGDGFAFMLEADLDQGTSDPCRRFGSSQLASTPGEPIGDE